MAMEFNLIPFDTLMEENGVGDAVDISASETRTFRCTMYISDVIEQESVDISIWGSADGQTWDTKPILKLPQRFYRGETRAVLELVFRPDVKFIRAQGELNRWGRVAPLPMFRLGLHLVEVPPMPLTVRLEPVVLHSGNNPIPPTQ